MFVVDRAKKIIYPEWVKEVLHPVLHDSGPKEYGGSEIELYIHPEQLSPGHIVGHRLHSQIVKTGMINRCMGLNDALTIQKQGIEVFRKIFKNTAPFFWKTVSKGTGKKPEIRVVFLYNGGNGEVKLSWTNLNRVWGDGSPAAVYKGSQEPERQVL